MANFSPDVIKLAQDTERKYGVPASVTLAQYATESGYGKSWLAKNANNFFGITGSYNGQKVYKTDRYWRKYQSMEESFADHGKLLSSGRYAQATKNAKTSEQYIDAIQPIYAPESDGNKGISNLWKTIIRQNNLTQYDVGHGGSSGSFATSEGDSTPDTVKDIGHSVLGAVIKSVSVIVISVLAVVLFLNAFNISIPSKTDIVKKVVKA